MAISLREAEADIRSPPVATMPGATRARCRPGWRVEVRPLLVVGAS